MNEHLSFSRDFEVKPQDKTKERKERKNKGRKFVSPTRLKPLERDSESNKWKDSQLNREQRSVHAARGCQPIY